MEKFKNLIFKQLLNLGGINATHGIPLARKSFNRAIIRISGDLISVTYGDGSVTTLQYKEGVVKTFTKVKSL